MKMHATRNALLTLGFTHDVQEPFREVDAAEKLAAMLRELCEEHWLDGDVRGKVRKAETLLARFGVP